MSKTKITIGFLALTLTAAAGITHFILPAHVQSQASLNLQTLGLDPNALPSPEISFGHFDYNNIILDEDEISTIENIRIIYDPLNLLAFKQLTRVEINGAKLIGEYKGGNEDSAANIAVAGWNAPGTLSTLSHLSARTIVIKGAEIALLTEALSGLNIQLNALAFKKSEGQYEYQAQIRSRQKNLSFSATAGGIITPQQWNAQLEIDQAKINLPAINSRLTRASGKTTITQDINGFKALTEFRAGGLNLHGTPWHNAALSWDYTPRKSKLFLSANSIGQEGVELALNALTESSAAQPFTSGQLYADNPENLSAYLLAREKIFAKPPADSQNANTLSFTLKDVSKKTLGFKYKTKSESGEESDGTFEIRR